MNQPRPQGVGPLATNSSGAVSHTGMDPATWCIVRAAAGSGKTRLLVRRLLRIALQGRDPTRFLAVTFTNKAAAEMKERLLSASREFLSPRGDQLARELGLDRSSPNVRGFYWNLLDLFSRIRVSTIHAFCNEVSSRFAWECNLAPQLKVLDAVQHQRLRQVCADSFLARRDWDDVTTPLGAAVAVLRAKGWKVSTLPGMLPALESASNLWRAWLLQHAGEEAREQLDLDPLLWPQTIQRPSPRAVWGPSGFAVPEADLAVLRGPQMHALLAFLESKESRRAPKKEELARRLASALGQKDVSAVVALLPELEGLARPDGTVWRTVVAQSDALSAARACWIPVLQQQGILMAEALNIVAIEYLAELQGLKRKLGVIDFSDMEWIASTLLTRDDAPGLTQYVLYSLSQRLQHLAVDEFQDTSDLQWQILRRLALLLTGQDTGDTGSTFCVGDVKQSIYRFRNAEPELMEVAQLELAEMAGNAGAPFAALTLDVSYRSTPAVLALTQALFDPARGTALTLPPGESAAVKGFRQGSNAWGKVVVEPYFDDDVAVNDEAAGSVDAANPEEEMLTPLQRSELLASTQPLAPPDRCALWCAQLVQHLVASQEPVFDSDLDGYRPARFGDILVLLETRTYAEHFEAAFRRSRIPFVAAGRGAMEARTEFQDLMAVVRWILRPMNDLAFVSLLRSPLFRIDDADLLALKRRPGSLDGAKRERPLSPAPDLLRGNWRNSGRLPSLWQVLQARSQSDDLPPALLEALPCLKRMEACWSKPPVTLFILLEREFGLLRRYGTVFNPGVEANFRLFWAKAVELEARGVGSLARFEEEMLLLASGEEFSDAPLPATDDAGMVRFLTVHGAKGLEAPIVILPDSLRMAGVKGGGGILMARDPVDRTIKGVVPDLGALYQVAATPETWPPFLPADPYLEALADSQRRGRDERACLNYVAVTRARDHLYVAGFRTGRQSANQEGTQGPSALHTESWEALNWLANDGLAPGLCVTSVDTENNRDERYRRRFTLESGQPPERLVRTEPRPLVAVPDRPPLRSGVSVLFEEEVASRNDVLTDAASEGEEASWGGVGMIAGSAKAIARGNALHGLMEALSTSRGTLSKAEALRLVLPQLKSSVVAQELVEEAFALFQDPEIGPYLVGPGLNEQPLVLRHSAKGVRYGIPDRVARTPEGFAILDYKTQRHPERVDQATRKKYAHQLATYGELLRQVFDRPGQPTISIRAFLLWTATRVLEEVPLQP